MLYQRGVLPVIANESDVFAVCANPVCTKQGDTVTANMAVQYFARADGHDTGAAAFASAGKAGRKREICLG